MSAPAAPATRHQAYRLGLCVACRTAPRTSGKGSALCEVCHAQPPADPAAAYRRGLCVTCLTAPASAGRTRCGTCHSTYTGTGAR